MKDLGGILRKVRKNEDGVYVQASTLGSLEALLEFLEVKFFLLQHGIASKDSFVLPFLPERLLTFLRADTCLHTVQNTPTPTHARAKRY